MKFSTFAIGTTFLFAAIGCGALFFTGETGSRHFESTVFAEKIPPSFSLSEGIVLGQAPDPVPTPPAKLGRNVTSTANPLRAADSPTKSSNPFRQVAGVDSSIDRPVTQAAGATPKNDTPSEKRLSGIDVMPDSFGSPQDNFLESAGFPGEPAPLPAKAPAVDPIPFGNHPTVVAPQQLPVPSPFDPLPDGKDVAMPSSPSPPSPLPERLGNADPFASPATSGAVPPIARPKPAADPTPLSAAPAAPVASGQKAAMGEHAAEPSFSTGEGTGSPGPIALEGLQTPHLTLEKVLPAEVVLDQPATIKTVVRNVGKSTARDVKIRDRVPLGARLLSTVPEATISGDGELLWSLGNLDGSEQLIVEMRIVPLREGEIGSVAVVNCTAEASARINVTRPRLQVDVKAPQEVRLGEIANLEITISNPGTATATGVVLEEYIPDGLYHKDGKVLINKNVDSLKPKEAKKLTLPLTCTGSGTLTNRLVVTADGNLKVEEKTTIRALAPILDLRISGPKQRFLERKSGYRLIVSNSGNASAQNVDLVMTLPPAVQFVSTNQSGVYEASTHSVHWALEELPPQEEGEIELVLLPGKIGNYMLRFAGNGHNNLKAETTHPIAIDGLEAISFDVVGESNLVEIGKEAVYEIRVANKGTKAASNVRIRAALSDGLTFVKADGPVRHQSQGGVVQFESLAQLESKGEKVYKIRARCMADGDHRISVQVVSDDLRAPITKEESTKVFQ